MLAEVKSTIEKLMKAMGRADNEDIPLPADLVDAIGELFRLYHELPGGYQPKITDVEMAGFTHLPDEPVRLKADGEKMMLEIVALEVLVDVLRSYPNVKEMARNAHGRIYPEWSMDEWENYFAKIVPEAAAEIGERDETIRQLRSELRAAQEESHARQ